MTPPGGAAALLLAPLLVAGGALAAKVEVATGFSHEPPRGLEAGESFDLVVGVDAPAKVRRARARYRTQGKKAFEKLDLKVSGKTLRATVPGDRVEEPGLEYYVVVQTDEGKVTLVVANPRFPVAVPVESLPLPAAPPPEVPPAPAQDKPAQGKPAQGKPAQGKPAQGKPAQGKPAQDKPAQDKPVAEDKEPPVDDAPGNASASALPAGQEAGPVGLEGDAPTVAIRRGPNVEGRRIPGGARELDAEGDPFLVEMAVWAAEDPTSFVADPDARPLVAAAPTEVIERERIERLGARTLMDVLQTLPGVSVARDISGFWEVTVRGLRGDRRLVVLLDGQPLHNPYDGRVMWDVPADMIERVELVRSPTPGTGGPVPAFAGVVRITTRRDAGFDARLLGGYYPTAAGGGAFGFEVGGFSMYGSGNARWTDGPRIAVERDSFTSTPFVRDPERLVTNANEATGGLALGMELDTGGTRLYARGRGFVESRGAYIGAFDTLGPDSELLWINGGGHAGVDVALGDFGHVDVRGWGDSHVVDRTWQAAPLGYRTEDRDNDGAPEEYPDGVLLREAYTALSFGAGTTLGVRVFPGNELTARLSTELGFLPAGGYTLAANRDLEGVALGQVQAVPDLSPAQNGPCPIYGAGVDALGACRLTTSLYVGDAWQLFDGFFVDGGVTFSSFSDVELDLLTHTNPHVGLSWTLFDRLTLRANAATGIRPPTWAERLDQRALTFVDFSAGAYVGNPALVPEALRTAELGADYRFRIADDRYRLWGTSFAYNVANAIDRIDLNGNVEMPGNYGGYDVVGAEGGGEVSFAGGSRAWMNVSWYRSWFRAPTDLDPDAGLCALFPFEAGAPCPLTTDQPQLRTNLGFEIDMGLLDVAAWAIVASERRNSSRTALERLRPYRIDPYALLNLTLRTKPLFDVVGAEASVFNLLDVPHKDNVPRPDRVSGLLPREGVAVYGGLFLDL